MCRRDGIFSQCLHFQPCFSVAWDRTNETGIDGPLALLASCCRGSAPRRCLYPAGDRRLVLRKYLFAFWWGLAADFGDFVSPLPPTWALEGLELTRLLGRLVAGRRRTALPSVAFDPRGDFNVCPRSGVALLVHRDWLSATGMRGPAWGRISPSRFCGRSFRYLALPILLSPRLPVSLRR